MQHHDNEHMTRERSRRDERRGSSDQRREDRGAFFGSGRGDYRGRDNDKRAPWAPRDDDQYGGRERMSGRDRERDPRFGSDAYHDHIPLDETRRLIASNKVEGTPVYGRDGDRIGSIHNFMVDKYSGKVVYAVLKGSSGFLGLGERYYPLDWDDLDYDTRDDGYRIDMTEKELKERRSFDHNGRETMDHDRGSRERGSNREGGFGRDRERSHSGGNDRW